MVKFIRKYFVPLCLVVFFQLSCSRPPVPAAPDESYIAPGDLKCSIVGMWESDALVVGIDTVHNSQTSVVLSVTSDEWKKKLKIQPVQTIFNPNKTYISAYTSIDGQLIKFTAGRWDVEKNNLSIHQLFPSDREMNYRIDLTCGAAELRSTLDFDGDGKDDDLYYCQMKKVG